jgi:hypothetical protein
MSDSNSDNDAAESFSDEEKQYSQPNIVPVTTSNTKHVKQAHRPRQQVGSIVRHQTPPPPTQQQQPQQKLQVPPNVPPVKGKRTQTSASTALTVQTNNQPLWKKWQFWAATSAIAIVAGVIVIMVMRKKAPNSFVGKLFGGKQKHPQSQNEPKSFVAATDSVPTTSAKTNSPNRQPVVSATKNEGAKSALPPPATLPPQNQGAPKKAAMAIKSKQNPKENRPVVKEQPQPTSELSKQVEAPPPPRTEVLPRNHESLSKPVSSPKIEEVEDYDAKSTAVAAIGQSQPSAPVSPRKIEITAPPKVVTTARPRPQLDFAALNDALAAASNKEDNGRQSPILKDHIDDEENDDELDEEKDTRVQSGEYDDEEYAEDDEFDNDGGEHIHNQDDEDDVDSVEGDDYE